MTAIMHFLKRRFFSARLAAFVIMLFPLLGSISAHFGNQTSRALPTDPSAKPALVFAQYHDDLGEIDELRSHDAAGFVFTNRSPYPVEIKHIRPSCGCLTTRLERSRIEPGSNGEFFLQIDTAPEASGQKYYTAEVVYETQNEQGQSIRTFTELVSFSAIIPEKKLVISPPALGFYLSGDGEPVSHLVELVDFRAKEFEILSIETDHPQIQAKLIGRKADAPRPTHQIEVQVHGTFTDKRLKYTILIKTTDETFQELKIPVLVQSMPAK